jgi:hypothetical protein
MPTQTEAKRPGQVVLSEANFHRSRDNIVIASGSGVIQPGHVLGKITASGKFAPHNPGVATGVENAAAVALYGCDATSADQKISAIVRDAEVKTDELVWDASVDLPAEKDAAYVELRALGIIPR